MPRSLWQGTFGGVEERPLGHDLDPAGDPVAGQVPHGLISCLMESCLAQHANHFLPGVFHSDHSPAEELLCAGHLTARRPSSPVPLQRAGVARCVRHALPVIVIRAGSCSYPPLHSAIDQSAGFSPVSSSPPAVLGHGLSLAPLTSRITHIKLNVQVLSVFRSASRSYERSLGLWRISSAWLGTVLGRGATRGG